MGLGFALWLTASTAFAREPEDVAPAVLAYDSSPETQAALEDWLASAASTAAPARVALAHALLARVFDRNNEDERQRAEATQALRTCPRPDGDCEDPWVLAAFLTLYYVSHAAIFGSAIM